MKAGSSLRSLTFPRCLLAACAARRICGPAWKRASCYASTCYRREQSSHARQTGIQDRSGQASGPRLDLQQHLADLEAAGLLVRIDRPINKDTELIPLVRWQFIGGMPEDQRRAFLFTNVIDSKGRRYDMPVVVGALASSPAIYAHRHGPAGRGDRRGLDARRSRTRSRRSPTNDAPCQEVVITGDALKTRRAESPAGAGLDAGLRRRALSHRDALRHHGSREPASATWAPIASR